MYNYINNEYYRTFPKKYLNSLNNDISKIEYINFSYDYKLFNHTYDVKELSYNIRSNFDYYNIKYNYGYDILDTVIYSCTERLLHQYYIEKKYITHLINIGHFNS